MFVPRIFLFMKHQKILILDFGSQYTQLIARKIRELNVFCEVHPFNYSFELTPDLKGIVLSGSPFSVNDANAPIPNFEVFLRKVPVLGICYGAQLMAKINGGEVAKSLVREYGRARLTTVKSDSQLMNGIKDGVQVWMSHGDSILKLPEKFVITASTENIPVAAYESTSEKIYAVQFHPEVYHSECGIQVLENFVKKICGCVGDWTPQSFVDETVENLKQQLNHDKVVLGLSGGVDSSVAALLLHRAIGKNLYCIFIDNGLLRKNEADEVVKSYQHLGLNIHFIDASQRFYEALKGIEDPEQKRKIIGRVFIEEFDKAAHQIQDVKWLAQGTIYPDVIESVSVKGPSATIKSHHNVGGLPEKMHLKVVEPLRMLFKDEVRRVGKLLNLPDNILSRHPFPGPGLAIRIIGEVTAEKVNILQEADAIYIEHLRKSGWYNKIWQAGTILLNTKSVGVMGDERTYEYVVALRAVHSTDGMTADWVHLPYDLLAEISNAIINQVKGVNRVVYDISSKPPATIEWE
ncbi:MAG: GMP synthase [glutamine-hydrolyzing] 1 [Bacteroidia bacterium]|nr:MAG: GMP synthase [glutamine-hydrolyzing] 1 [Bacteroidia bacterium]